MSGQLSLDHQSSGHGLKSDTFAEGVVVLLVMMVIQRAIGFARGILFCRWLDAESLGQWDLTFSFLELAAPIVVLSLPSSFGRYLEQYRRRNQVRAFLFRIGLATLTLLAVSVGVLLLLRTPLALLIYGQEKSVRLIFLVLLCLPALVLFNTICEVFNGLRMCRVVSGLHFLQSLLFASLGIGLLLWQGRSAESVVLAFGAACAVCCCVASLRLRAVWRSSSVAVGGPDSLTGFWAQLLPFAAAVWVSNWFGNLFGIADRYMLVHFSGMQPAEALIAVGQYHSSRIVPVLLISVASLLGSMVLPYLSRNWEAGQRTAVAAQVVLFVKVIGLVLTSAAVALSLGAPFLFGWVLGGRFEAGMAVFEWTLMYSVWFGMFCIAKTYLWCDEKVRLSGTALLLGLLVNVGLNLLLLPRFGLPGAVWATCVANLTALLVVYGFSHLQGMRLDVGVWLITAAPLMLCLGPWVAASSLTVVLALALSSDLVFREAEKHRLLEGARQYWDSAIARWQEGGAVVPMAVER